MLDKTIGFLGAGQMATALAVGLIRGGGFKGRLLAADPLPVAREKFHESIPSAIVHERNLDVAQAAEVLVLAVKPQQVAEVAAEIGPAIDESRLLISIAAGVTIANLAGRLPQGTRIVRAMPNTPCLIGLGCSAYSLSDSARSEDDGIAAAILGNVGEAFAVEEKLLDAVTGLSGSGPAYVFTVIEALSDGGVAAGLPRALATRMAALTVQGAAAMVTQSGDHPAVLRERVTSPAGTTVAGLAELERGGVRSLFASAVRAAALRSSELGVK